MKNGIKIDRLDKLNKPYHLCINPDTIDDAAIDQFENCMKQPSVVQSFLAPDYHLGYTAPIGSVFATKDAIFPSFCGFDIGCGVSECLLDIPADSITKEQFTAIKNQILRDIPIGFKRHNNLPKKLPLPLMTLINMPITQTAKSILEVQGQAQLGTLGGGNHFLEVCKSVETGNVSIVVHSGSRGVGHKIATHYMREAAVANTDIHEYGADFDRRNVKWLSASIGNGTEGKYQEAKRLFVSTQVDKATKNIEDAYPLDVNTQLGKDYINDMNMCLEFALANRKQMIDKCIYAVQRVLTNGMNTGCEEKIGELRFINRNHNHAELIEESAFYKD